MSNLKRYLPRVLEDENNLEHSFTYDNNTIIDYSTIILNEDDTNKLYVKHPVSNRI